MTVITHDALPAGNEPGDPDMNWASGQEIMRAARFVARHPALFGVFVTNFSCGPDSFLVGYFRRAMGDKPSLTLELDSHTADAGLNTRVEAFLDIVERYRKIGSCPAPRASFRPAVISGRGRHTRYIDSTGKSFRLDRPPVTVLIPSMGRLNSEGFAALLEGFGFRARSLPVPGQRTLMMGRSNTSGKECLPLILTAGSLADYLEKPDRDPGERIAYFMPTAAGNCRFAQYRVFLGGLIADRGWENVATWSLTSENGYAGLSVGRTARLLEGIVIADVMDDLANTLAVLAADPEEARAVFESQWKRILGSFRDGCRDLDRVLTGAAGALGQVPLARRPGEVPVVSLMGEIFVRRDEFSGRDIIARLSERGIIAHRAPVLEWLGYVDYLVSRGLIEGAGGPAEKAAFLGKVFLQRRIERKVKRIFSRSGLCDYHLLDIDRVMEQGRRYMDERLTGESILVVGSFFLEILDRLSGVISLGPFACMPTRIIEAILSREATSEAKSGRRGRPGQLPPGTKLPFLSIETDGNPFPQVVEARLEAFCLQVERVHRALGQPGPGADSRR